MNSPAADDEVPAPFAAEAAALVREVKDYAIFMLDPKGRILSWNEGARAIKGYRADEIVGQHFSRFFTEEDRAEGRPAELLARAAAEGRVGDERWRVRKDGRCFWASVVITAVHDDRGRLQGFVKVTRDLTEQRRTDALLRQSEERLRLLVESVKDYAIFMLDPAGCVTTWSGGAERIHGHSSEQIVGKHFSSFYPSEAVEIAPPERELQLAERDGRHEEEGWRLRRDGSRFWAHVVVTSIRDPESGALRGFAMVTRDLTEPRRMEARARSAQERAEQARRRAEEARRALEQRDEFLSVAAHELRTPLTALLLLLQSVTRMTRTADGQPSDQLVARLAPRLDGALRQVQRLTELVERLLEVSRIARGRLVMDLRETNLTQLLRRVVDDFREPARAAGCEIRFRATGDVVGVWDASRLEQAFVNLLSNAVKYGMGRPVEVSVEATDDGARVRVTDHGIGIAPEDRERIFARFGRAAPLSHFAGLGLGLYVARNLVEAHGGSVCVSGRQGDETTFTVDLPA